VAFLLNMNDVAIRVENLSKRYRIHLVRQRYQTLRDEIADGVRSLFQRNGRSRQQEESFWALRDVSFEVKHGEVVGIIGRNGAGKSTLLKVLSRITEPTEGRATIHGRVASLLEVGTGFHRELSGRENIYLNGAMLGMKKAEIDRKFDEIVAFSEVGQFIDTPVKRYSSGMYVRLAFAVAAHLEPEIVIVDEVLAVGDVAFQKKCLGKMEGMAHQGRTVLFVSHNMLSVQSLCTRAIVLQQGRICFDGEPQQATAEYLAAFDRVQAQSLESREKRVGGDAFRFVNVEFLNPDTISPLDILISGQPVLIRLHFVNRSKAVINDVSCSISFFTFEGVHLCGCRARAVGTAFDIPPSSGYTDCLVPRWPLSGGRYSYHLYAEREGSIALDWVQDAGVVQVESGDYFGTGFIPSRGRQGVFVDYSWKATPQFTSTTNLSAA
jgi:lipopolysaccharide transport system ATP-binding protein